MNGGDLPMIDDLKRLKKEFVFYYESRQNPNGDPGFENQPRLMPDGTILVTDVRVKRTIRDYAKNRYGETLFVDFGEDGVPVTADQRAEEIFRSKGLIKKGEKLKSFKGDIMQELLINTFDTSLFGALVTIRGEKKGLSEDEEGKSGSKKLTGPVQLGIGRSVNQVQVINPMISGRFVGKVKEGQEQFSTFGKFYSVEYALIKIQGAVNPMNLDQYLDNPKITKKFLESEERLFECLWNGTNSLITRSKFPQRSIFYLEVTYDAVVYNDLPLLMKDDESLKGKVTGLSQHPLDCEKLVSTLRARKAKVKEVRVAACRELASDVSELVEHLKAEGIATKIIPTEDPKW